jgi:sialate O-acetylesterase
MKMSNSYRFTLALIFLTGFGLKSNAQTATSFKLANLLQSNMVIQQAKPLRVWGTANPGDIISINADWTGNVTTARADEQGNWLGEIKVPKAIPGNFKPHTLVVIDGNDNIKLDNLLIGDVWFCVGQSNMDFVVEPALMLTYRGVLNYQTEIAAANYPAIRIYHCWTDFKINPVTTTTGIWKVCNPETIKNFSGVAYYFGRELFLKLNIPIGLVESAAAGASTQAFTSREVLESDNVLKHTYLDKYRDLLSSQKAVDTTGFFSKVTKPTLLYNDIIYPVLNLSIKGIVYYQGESNIGDKRETYIPLFTAMVANWRRDFKQGDFPFYFTQIAPYRDTKDTTTWAAANFRDIQEQLLKIKNTGMAVTMDVGEERNVQPRDKKSVGERLAFNALNKTYHLKNIPYLGPHISTFKVQGNTVTLSFDAKSIGTGLSTNDGKAPRHFFVAGADRQFYYADARIVGDRVVLTSDKVANPVAIRYAFTDAPVTNLQNREGLPALPFRTDNW